MNHQVCHCGWSKVTTYQGLRIHQGKKGCTPKGMHIPESDSYNSYIPRFTYVGPPIKVEEPFKDLFSSTLKPESEPYTWGNQWEASQEKDVAPIKRTTPVMKENVLVSPNLTNPTMTAAQEDALAEILKSFMVTNSDRSHRALDFPTGTQPSLKPVPQILSTQVNPAVAEVTVKETNKPLFQTPPQHHITTHQTTTNARRALDFSTSAPQMGQLLFGPPTTAAQEAVVRPKEKERESQNLQKNVPLYPNFTTPTIPAATEPSMITQQHSLPNSDKSHQVLDFFSGVQPSWMPMTQIFGTQAYPAAAGVTVQETNKPLFQVPTTTAEETAVQLMEREKEKQREAQKLQKNVPLYPNFTTPTIPAATEPSMITQQHSLPNSDKSHQVLDLFSGVQPSLMPMTQIFGTQAYPAAAGVTVQETNKPLFQVPTTTAEETAVQLMEREKEKQREAQKLQKNVPLYPNFTTPTIPAATEPFMITQQHSLPNSDKSHQVRDLFSGVQPSRMPMTQIFGTQAYPAAAGVTVQETNKPLFQFPTTTAEETAVQLMEREKEKQKQREAQKLQKARQDRVRADLQQKIKTKEQKIGEVSSSVKACKGGLDAEWLEINNAFSEVMKVVEDARQRALQPLEERRERVKREAHDLIKKLKKEIDKLKNTIDELDKNPELQVLNQSRDWKNVTVDTSFSFGTLRTTTSSMMEQIHQELDKLSSVELKRIPTFAVDVKLDPISAHCCLVLSPDGKMVMDGGKSQKVPDAPHRFDMYGSILGLNRLSSGKSYWEVEVSNKTGWDLGVARRDANRKGELSLNPDHGYWVTVHYDNKKYAAMATPPVSLSLKEKPQKVGVFVDYEEGLVSFYDVKAQSHIYSFTECSFRGEIFPYFSPHLEQNGKNSHPLIISAVRKQ